MDDTVEIGKCPEHVSLSAFNGVIIWKFWDFFLIKKKIKIMISDNKQDNVSSEFLYILTH